MKTTKITFLLQAIIITVCHGQVKSASAITDLTQDVVINIAQRNDIYTQIIEEHPNGGKDTLWIEGIVIQPTWKIQKGNQDQNLSVLSDYGDTKKVIIKDVLYPKDALKKGIEGKVELYCIVERDGSLSNISVQKSLFPTIDAEAHRLLSKIKLTPCLITNRTFRCRHKVALSFAIEKDRKNKKEGRVYIVNADELHEGVAKRFKCGITRTQTTTKTHKDRYGFVNRDSYMSGQWHTSLEIDIPANNPVLEETLCKILFNKKGTDVEKVGKKFSKSFEGRTRNKDFKGLETTDFDIKAHVIGYKPERFYSYSYEVTANHYKKIAYNFVYDIQSHRILNITDVLSQQSIEKFVKETGITDLNQIELGLNEYFLYMTQRGDHEPKILSTITLSKENSHLFSPLLLNLIGGDENLPSRIDKADFIEENGVGVLPKLVLEKIVKYPSLNNGYTNSGFIKAIIKSIKEINSINKDFTANVSYVIEKDGSLSNISVTQEGGDKSIQDDIISFLETLTKCQPLSFATEGPVRSYHQCVYKNQ